jgi:hypothetical protein
MAEMVPFRYVEFYDVPRTIALRYRGKLLLLQSAFDEKVDKYPNSYSVYVLPESAEASLVKSSWEFLENTGLTCIGQIAVEAVRFDPTKRKALDSSVLDNLTIAIGEGWA